MFESLMRGVPSETWRDYPGPGPADLLFGTEDAGYFGEVSQAELLSPAQVLAQLPELNKTATNPTATWLKFIYNKRIIYVSKMPIVSGATWYQLYDAGLVYGTDDDGIVPAAPPRNQIKIVAKDAWRFKARLIRNDLSDPSYLGVNINDTTVRNSEYTDLMYKMYGKVIENYPVKWASFTDVQLGASAGYELLRETQASSPTMSYMRSATSLISRAKDNNTFFNRIVLELIDNDIFSLKNVFTTNTTPMLKSIGSVSVSIDESSNSLLPLAKTYQAVATGNISIGVVNTLVEDTSSILPITAKSMPSMGRANGNTTFSIQ